MQILRFYLVWLIYIRSCCSNVKKCSSKFDPKQSDMNRNTVCQLKLKYPKNSYCKFLPQKTFVITFAQCKCAIWCMKCLHGSFLCNFKDPARIESSDHLTNFILLHRLYFVDKQFTTALTSWRFCYNKNIHIVLSFQTIRVFTVIATIVT